MRKFVPLFLAVLLLLPLVSGCGEKEVVDETMKEIFDATQYTLYVNVVVNKSDEYTGKTFTVTGNAGSLVDRTSGKTRYYVWGYADQTKCCDWQWEYVPADVSAVPVNGSVITVTGTLSKSDDALDKFWLTEASVKTDRKYAAPAYDLDLTAISPTLARVQLAFMKRDAKLYDGSTILLFGRTMDMNSLQHPYYYGEWEMEVSNTMFYALNLYMTVDGVFCCEDDGSYYVDVKSAQ